MARTITHAMEEVETRDKVDRLARFIRQEADGPVLVFVRTKIGADKVARNLQAKGVRAAALHADRSQLERQRAVEGFRSGAASRCWWPPTSPPAASTSTASRSS